MLCLSEARLYVAAGCILISIRHGVPIDMTSLLAILGRRAVSLTLVAAFTTIASLGVTVTEANAGTRYRPSSGFHAGHLGFGGRGFERRGFGHGGFGRGDLRHGGFARGFGGFGGGDFGDDRVSAGLGAATLALGIFGAVASAAAEQQAVAQPQCGIANQPVLRPNGTYYYRRVQVCQ